MNPLLKSEPSHIILSAIFWPVAFRGTRDRKNTRDLKLLQKEI